MSWFQNLQKQAQDALKVVQEDLAEFGKTVKDDTEEVVETVMQEAPKLQEKLIKEDLPELTKKSAEVSDDIKQGLSTVTQNFATFSKSIVTGTTEIFSQVQEAVQMEMETKKQKKSRERKPRAARETTTVGTNGKYSRYESQVSAMQRDSSTYCDKPTDEDDFNRWLKTFEFDKQQDAIAEVLKDNAFMQELQSRIVPLIVDQETFWTRYFYRLGKLQEAHNQREQLVQRAQNTEEEEELSWDAEDAEDETETAAEPTATQPESPATVAEASTTGGVGKESHTDLETASGSKDMVADEFSKLKSPSAPITKTKHVVDVQGDTPTVSRVEAEDAKVSASPSTVSASALQPAVSDQPDTEEEEELDEDWGEEVDEDWGDDVK